MAWESLTGPAQLRRYRTAPVAQAGYSRDRQHVMTYNDSCAIARIASRPSLIRHSCDATFGDSGSPLFLRQGVQLTLIGIHIGPVRHRAVLPGLGLLVDGFAEALRAAQRSQPGKRPAIRPATSRPNGLTG